MAKTKNYVLQRRCQVNTGNGAVFCDPKGYGATIENFPVSKIKPCKSCKGTGIDVKCRPCMGAGEVKVMRAGELTVIKCSTCEGSGKVEGQECYYCKGTKRSYPPHHYQELNEDGEVDVAEEQEEKKEFIIAELTKLGVAIDKRWGIDKLENELVQARRLRS